MKKTLVQNILLYDTEQYESYLSTFIFWHLHFTVSGQGEKWS